MYSREVFDLRYVANLVGEGDSERPHALLLMIEYPLHFFRRFPDWMYCGNREHMGGY